jgi:hypothetical protein
MEHTAMPVWADFGLSGLVIGALFLTLWKGYGSIVIKVLDLHQTERAGWRASFERVTTQFDARQAETNELLRELAGVLARCTNEQKNQRN